jgi:molybdopterin/thiamine biosynthesis adenylyltransferase
MSQTLATDRKRPSKHVLVAGVGNIGSSLIPHLARLPDVDTVTIVDRDIYEAGNVGQADITPGDVGLAKAGVQVRRLRRLSPSLHVRAVQADLHNIPLGMFRTDFILAALDSREARRVVNEAAWRLGVPWVDAGINADGGLMARVTVYVPASNTPCLECSWADTDYDLLEQSHPCQRAIMHGVPTNAPASLGALAAAMQALELQKLLDGDRAHALCGRQVLVDARHHTSIVSGLRRNPACRFDHGIWQVKNIEQGRNDVTLNHIIDSYRQKSDPQGGTWIRVEGRPFVRRFQCPLCGRTQETLCLLGRTPPRRRACCRRLMEPVGFDMVDRLDLTSLDRRTLALPLTRLGLRKHDVVTVGSGEGDESHYEIGGDRR